MKFCRPIGVVLMVLILSVAVSSQAAPPRIIDEDEAVQQATFEELDGPEMPRSLSPRSAPADSNGRTKIATKKTSGPVSLWGTVICLAGVFSLFLGARVWLTRHGPVGMRGLPQEALELLGKRTIEPRVSIHIVRCGPKVLVLGVSPEGVRTLTEITDPVEIDLLAGACRKSDSAASLPASFAGMFQKTGNAELPRGAA